MKIKIELNLDKVLIEEAGDFLIEAEAEETILKIIGFKKQCDEALNNIAEKVGKTLAEAKRDQIQGDDIVIKLAGYKYKVDSSKVKPSFAKESTVNYKRYYPKVENIELFLNKYGNLPEGVENIDRKPTIMIKRGKK